MLSNSSQLPHQMGSLQICLDQWVSFIKHYFKFNMGKESWEKRAGIKMTRCSFLLDMAKLSYKLIQVYALK